MYRPYLRPINLAEALLEPFYANDPASDGSRLPILDAYDVTWHETAEGELSAPARIDIRRAPADAWGVRLHCHCDIELGGYDQVRFSVSMPNSMWFELEAEIDGRPVALFTKTFGNDGCEVHVAPFRGRRLTAYSITVGVAGGEGRHIGDLHWLSVADRRSLERLDGEFPVFPDDWPGLLAPEGESAEAAPQLGLFFDVEGLGELRRLLRAPPYRVAYESLRQSAEGRMGDWVPERLVSPGRPRAWMGVGVCDELAFVGLIEDNRDMSRLAARTALAAAHCGDWSRANSLREPMPGILTRDRCFGESFYLRALPLVLDWAGHMLTPYGREVIRDAMIRNGIGPVESVFMRWEYIRSMNQGIMFGIGRILAYLALQRTYPRYQTALEQAQADMAEMLDNYIMEDGGTREGMGYWHVIADVLPLYFALARQTNATLTDVAPPRLVKTGAFALGMRSIRGDGLTWLPVNQVHHDTKITARVAAAFTALTPDSEWPDVYQKVMACGHGMDDMFHLLLAPGAMRVVAETETGGKREGKGEGRGTPPGDDSVQKAELAAFPAVGQVSLHSHDPQLGRVHLHLCSGPSKGGHSHQDKGSFILEVGDDVLALDRGTTTYDNPAHLLMWRAECHNLVCPRNEDGEFLEQAPRETEGGRILDAGSRDGRFEVLSDNAPAWPDGVFTRNTRRIAAMGEGQFEIEDDLEMPVARRLCFQLHTNWPVVETDGGWRIVADKAALTITPLDWQPVVAGVTREGIDYHKNPVNVLRLETDATRTARLRTRLTVSLCMALCSSILFAESMPTPPSPNPSTLPVGLNVLVIGDSNTEIGHITGDLARRFEQRYGYFGSGYRSLNATIGMGSGYLPYLKIENLGAWQKPAMVQPGAPKPYAAPDGCYIVGTVAGLRTEIEFHGSAVDVYWLATEGGGDFTIGIDGGETKTVATDSGDAPREVRKTRIDGLPAATHRLTLSVTTAPVTLLGVDVRLDPRETQRRAVVHKWGKGWATTKDFVDIDPNVFKEALRLLAPDFAVIILGTNDHNLAGYNRDQYADGLREIVGRIRAATPARVLVLSTFQVNSPWSNNGLRAYRDILPELCRELGVFYWDMSAWFSESWAQANEAGWMADAVHVNAAGGKRIAEGLDAEIQRITAFSNLVPQTPEAGSQVGDPAPANALPRQVDGLSSWWRADGQSILDSDGKVVRWLDSAGTGTDALAPWAAARPLRVENAYHDKPVLRFDGKTSHLRFPMRENAQTIIAVFRGKHLILGHPHFNTRPFHPGVVRPHKAFSANYAAKAVIGGRGFLNGRPVHIGDDQEDALEFDGGKLQIFSLVMDEPVPFSYLGWGGSWNFNKYLAGDMAEMIVYNRALTDQERQKLESYLAARWQIPLAPGDGR